MNDDLEKLFSAIDSVPWPRIEHSFGPATDVPDLIRGLTSPDVNVRNDAWSKLHENIWHQGTIYEATSYAVPVFLELLQQPATPGKHDVLAFLALLFAARSYWDVHQHTALLQSEVGKPGFQQRLEQELVSLGSGHQGCCGQTE
jgi:hypothetical protein